MPTSHGSVCSVGLSDLALHIAACAGQWRPFTGNEIGIMLAEWILRNYRQRQHQGQPAGKQKLAMLSSTVSSRMLGAVAEQEGMHWAETLTGKPTWLVLLFGPFANAFCFHLAGFKWLGNEALKLEAQGCACCAFFA